jgi:lytic cellulose monooxygenase (C1-hydroxylating)
MNNYNVCIAKSQPKPDWAGCGATKDTCLAGARYQRLRRSGTVGRLF